MKKTHPQQQQESETYWVIFFCFFSSKKTNELSMSLCISYSAMLLFSLTFFFLSFFSVTGCVRDEWLSRCFATNIWSNFRWRRLPAVGAIHLQVRLNLNHKYLDIYFKRCFDLVISRCCRCFCCCCCWHCSCMLLLWFSVYSLIVIDHPCFTLLFSLFAVVLWQPWSQSVAT